MPLIKSIMRGNACHTGSEVKEDYPIFTIADVVDRRGRQVHDKDGKPVTKRKVRPSSRDRSRSSANRRAIDVHNSEPGSRNARIMTDADFQGELPEINRIANRFGFSYSGLSTDQIKQSIVDGYINQIENPPRDTESIIKSAKVYIKSNIKKILEFLISHLD